MGADALVINMRCGSDIFSGNPKPGADYMQTPLSFYRRIKDNGRFDDYLIVMERDQLNPVIGPFLKYLAGIYLNQHRSVNDDILLALAAWHLVLAHSTFTWCLALTWTNLEVLHQPETFRIQGVPEVKISTWSTRKFVKPGEWEADELQMRMMVKHSDENLSSKVENFDYLPLLAFGVTNDPEQLKNIEISRKVMQERMRLADLGSEVRVGECGESQALQICRQEGK